MHSFHLWLPLQWIIIISSCKLTCPGSEKRCPQSWTLSFVWEWFLNVATKECFWEDLLIPKCENTEFAWELKWIFVKHNILFELRRKKSSFSTPRCIYSRKKGLSGFLSVIKTQFVFLPTEWILYVYVPCSPNLWGLGLQYVTKEWPGLKRDTENNTIS